jgi:hypothetical protein
VALQDDPWQQLAQGFQQTTPPIDLLARVQAKEAAMRQHRRTGWRRSRPVALAVAAFSFAAVLVVLAIAAHSRSNAPHATAAKPASAAERRILRETYADRRSFHLASSITQVSQQLPIALVRPDAALASDGSIDSVWISNADTSGQKSIVLIWKSGVVETIERWRCNCEALASLKHGGRRKPFHFMMLRGAPAMTAPSNPAQRGWRGFVPPATAEYGVPASVETIRDGYNITFFRYGTDALPGLLAAVRTLPPAHAAFDVNGYEAGGAALGNWNGAHGIDVTLKAKARFGIGVALRNITTQPLSITGVHAINGFIRLIGTHIRPYTPPTGSALGPPIVQRPYDATPPNLSYQLQPKTWAGLQLDFQIENPCTRWAQTIYDRTVEVTYTQDGHTHIEEVPLVPLNITRPHPC